MGTIYMIRNIKTDKRYVGQTTQDVQKRFRQHVEGAYMENKRSYNTCLSRSIRKYGADFFELGILSDHVPDESLDVVEAHYIDMYNTLAPNGYNKSAGFNDTANFDEMDEMTPEDDYRGNAKVVLDEISDDEVDRFLKEL